MNHIAKMLTLGATGLILAGPALAQETITLDVLYAQPGFARFHEPIAAEYMRLNPHVTIHYRAPARDYDEGHLLMQRLAVTDQLPDIYYPGYHLASELVRMLQQRDQVLDLQVFLDAEPDEWKQANYSDALLDLGKVDGVQYGMAFNASLPIMYINKDALESAGLDPQDIPDNWDDVLAQAVQVQTVNPDMAGMGFAIQDWPNDWLWQAMLRQAGTTLVDPETGQAGFDNEAGLSALELLRRFVTEGGVHLVDFEQSRQQFIAGQAAFFFDTPARLNQVIELVGDRFTLGTGAFPISDRENGGLPTGGASVIITASDETTQRAAWDFIKFATGPEAQKIIVETTGYLPTNVLAQGPDYLGSFYDADPRFQTVASQTDLARPWEGYPGGESVRIWRAQRDIINNIMRGDLSAEEGLAELVTTTNSMLE